MSSTNDNTKGGVGPTGKNDQKSRSSKKTVKFAYPEAEKIPDKEYSQKYHPDVKAKSAKTSENKKA